MNATETIEWTLDSHGGDAMKQHSRHEIGVYRSWSLVHYVEEDTFLAMFGSTVLRATSEQELIENIDSSIKASE